MHHNFNAIEHLAKKGRFLVQNSKKLTFSDYYVNKTHKHLN